MNAAELRIGNYVHPCSEINQDIILMNNIYSRIFTLEFRGTKLANDSTKSFAEQECYLYEYNKISPIPLTEEIILKCGFKLIDGWFVKNRIKLFNINNKYFTAGHRSEINIDIISLHQLQNLYFSLTGEELEFKTENNS